MTNRAGPTAFDAGGPVEPADLLRLYRQTHWARERTLDDVVAMLRATPIHVAAWRDGRLVGFARALSDGVYRAFIEDVVIDEACRGAGLGRALVARLLDRIGPVEEIRLNCRESVRGFYEEFGFARDSIIHMTRRGG